MNKFVYFSFLQNILIQCQWDAIKSKASTEYPKSTEVTLYLREENPSFSNTYNLNEMEISVIHISLFLRKVNDFLLV